MEKKSTPNLLQEGKAQILNSEDSVFYNPAQELNRNLSIEVLRLHAKETLESKGFSVNYNFKTSDKPISSQKCNELIAIPGESFKEGLVIFEGLAASGLRSIRYAKEIPGICQIIANDFSKEAVNNIKENIKLNQVDNMIECTHSDAALFMYNFSQHGGPFDVIDIDPYGSPTQFLDAAVQAIKEGGILCVTCTDMAVLCGVHPETCFSKYGGLSLHTKFGHEMALRIVLHSIQSHASRYHKYIVPLLSISVDFYVRLFVKVHHSKSEVKKVPSKLAMVYNCIGCQSFTLQPLGKIIDKKKRSKFSVANGPPVNRLCENCDSQFQIGGPVWAGKLCQLNFIQDLLQSIEQHPEDYNNYKRMRGLFYVLKEELIDCPFYYDIAHLCSIIRCVCPPQVKIRSALLNLGYEVSSSHASKNVLKTNAPSAFIWDIMRAWEKINPIKREKLKKNQIGLKILSKNSSLQVSFAIRPDAIPKSKEQGLLRFPENPPNWGPKAKAKRPKKDP